MCHEVYVIMRYVIQCVTRCVMGMALGVVQVCHEVYVIMRCVIHCVTRCVMGMALGVVQVCHEVYVIMRCVIHCVTRCVMGMALGVIQVCHEVYVIMRCVIQCVTRCVVLSVPCSERDSWVASCVTSWTTSAAANKTSVSVSGRPSRTCRPCSTWSAVSCSRCRRRCSTRGTRWPHSTTTCSRSRLSSQSH